MRINIIPIREVIIPIIPIRFHIRTAETYNSHCSNSFQKPTAFCSNIVTQKNSALSAPAGLNKLTCKSLAGAPTAQIEHQMVHQEQQKPPFCPRGDYYSFAMMRVSL